MRLKSLLISTSSTVALTCVIAAPAPAQSVNATTAKPKSAIEEVVVTATKRTTAASRTPIALSVLSGTQLRQQGIVSIGDLQTVLPSVVVGNSAHGPNISIRGITATDITSKGSPDVDYNIDFIPIGAPEVIGLSFYDLSDIEVLRGPQGTLYGKSSVGGTIDLVTAKPTNQYQGFASVDYGNYNFHREEAMVNLPITDSFAIRIAAVDDQRDGWLKGDLGTLYGGKPQQLNNQDDWSSRITARYTMPNDYGNVILTGTFGNNTGSEGTDTVLYSRWQQTGGQYNGTLSHAYYNPYAGKPDDNFVNYNGEVNLNLGPVKATYDGAYQRFSADDNIYPNDNNPAANGNSFNWSQYHALITTEYHELRFTNRDPGQLDYIAGLNYYREVLDEKDLNWSTVTQPVTIPGVNGGNPIPCPTPSLTPGCTSPNPNIVGPSIHPSKGVFGQLNWHLLDRKLTLTLGGRYQSDETERYATVAAGGTPPGGFRTYGGGICVPPYPCIGPTGPGGVTNDTGIEKSSKFTYRIGASYQITPTQLVYGFIASGYKPGGFNDLDPKTHEPAPYGPESLTDYEVGYKGRILPNLQYSTGFYYYDYARYQLTGATFLTPSATGGAPLVLIYTTNPPATVYGWENELHWNVTDDDTFSGTLSLERGYFGKGATVGFIFSHQIDWSGHSLDQLPTASGTMSYDHHFDLGNSGSIVLHANTKISSSYVESDLGGNGNPFSGVYSVYPNQPRQPTYTRSDFWVQYNSPSGKWNLQAYVHNVENNTQLLTAPEGLNTNPLPADYAFVRVSDPRFYGIRLTAKF